jgi:hypothetical protein
MLNYSSPFINIYVFITYIPHWMALGVGTSVTGPGSISPPSGPGHTMTCSDSLLDPIKTQEICNCQHRQTTNTLHPPHIPLFLLSTTHIPPNLNILANSVQLKYTNCIYIQMHTQQKLILNVCKCFGLYTNLWYFKRVQPQTWNPF